MNQPTPECKHSMGGRCFYCGKTAEEIDQPTPESKGIDKMLIGGEPKVLNAEELHEILSKPESKEETLNQACGRVFKEMKNPESKEDWEKEFDDIFIHNPDRFYENIKDFIRSEKKKSFGLGYTACADDSGDLKWRKDFLNK